MYCISTTRYAVATIFLLFALVRLLIEGGYYLRVTFILLESWQIAAST